MKGLIGKKIGMTQVYGKVGNVIPVTAILAGPCTVVALRTQERDGYSAVQLGFLTKKLTNVPKAVRGHVNAAGFTAAAPAILREIRTPSDPEHKVGDQLSVDIFEPGQFLDVTGTSKGQGFQGVIKRYRFGGGRASHGGDWERRGGSIGMCISPGKVYKGRKMPGHMGNRRITTHNLEIIEIHPEDNIILVKGAVPGANGNFVIIRDPKKAPKS